MKTIELKWIEDDNHVVAEDAYTGLKDLIDTGVFKTLSTECKDDVLYITGEQDELDKAVMKIQKAYAKYGQIMIKEAKKEGGLRIESYDDNVQEIFDYTVKEFDKLKENKHSADYITKLGDLQIKFMKLKEAAGRKDKATIQNYLDEISTLTENAEVKKIKPIRMKVNEEKIVSDELSYDEALKKQLSNPANWGIIEEKMTRWEYNDKFERVARMYAEKVGKDTEDVYDELMDNDELPEYVDSDMSVYDIVYKVLTESTMNESLGRAAYNKKFNKVAIAYAREMGISVDDAYEELLDNDETPDLIDSVYDVDEIVYKLMNESTMNESLLSPKELKKKLQRVAMKWASEEGIKFEVAYNDLRKRKSVKDMLDFYTVDEIIDDLKKKKKEVDDELEEEI